jgi:hypothetical protein
LLTADGTVGTQTVMRSVLVTRFPSGLSLQEEICASF